MEHRPQVLVYDAEHVPENWRRFLAILCFIEFWVAFQERGLWFWKLQFDTRWFSSQDDLLYVIESGAGLCRALCFWALGRALWRGHRHFWRPALGVLACSFLMIWASTLVTLNHTQLKRVIGDMGTDWWGMTIWLRSSPLLYRALEIVPEHLPILPWLCVLVWSVLSRRVWQEGDRCPWVIIAGIWCFCLSLSETTVGGYGFSTDLEQLLAHRCSLYLPVPLTVVYIALPTIYGLWLLFAKGGLRLLPIVLALLNILEIAAYADCWVPQVICADGSLKFICNQTAFWSLFFTPVSQAGPWLLIAIWAKTYPARVPAGDGSPFPRRYCGNCLYNLHGITADRCPECGSLIAELEAQPPVDLCA